MITSLTEAQKAQMAAYRDKWIEIGLSTAPADRPRAERALRAAYRAAGLREPRSIVWCGSPLAQGLTRALILDPAFWASLKLKPGNPGASVRDSVISAWSASTDSG